MLRGVYNFYRRHRRKLFVTGAVIGGTYILGRFLKQKFQEWQEERLGEEISNYHKQQLFKDNARACKQTINSLLATICTRINEYLNADEYTSQLKSATLQGGDKLEMWKHLKVVSFSRAIAAVYAVSMMVVLTHVQVNILGGYMYLYNKRKEQFPQDILHQYLEMSSYLLGPGLSHLAKVIKSGVDKSLAHFSLKENISLDNLNSIVMDVCRYVEKERTSSLLVYMLPEANEEEPANTLLDRLVSETRDIMDSSDFHTVLAASTHCLFDCLLSEASCGERRPLAKYIPVMSNMVPMLCDANQVRHILQLQCLQTFSANVYETFSCQQNELNQELAHSSQ